MSKTPAEWAREARNGFFSDRGFSMLELERATEKAIKEAQAEARAAAFEEAAVIAESTDPITSSKAIPCEHDVYRWHVCYRCIAAAIRARGTP